MKVGFAPAIALGWTLALAAPAFAADHEQPEHPAAAADHAPAGAPAVEGSKLAAQFFNFAALVIILYLAGRGPVSKALLARHQQLKSELQAAAEVRAAAQERLEKQEKRLAALEQEIEAIRAGIKQEAEAEKARMIAAAEDRARRIREEATFMIDQQVKEAEVELRREAARAAVDLAERLVRTSFTPGDQQRLVDTFVTDVAGNGQPAAPPPAGPPSGNAAPATRSEI